MFWFAGRKKKLHTSGSCSESDRAETPLELIRKRPRAADLLAMESLSQFTEHLREVNRRTVGVALSRESQEMVAAQTAMYCAAHLPELEGGVSIKPEIDIQPGDNFLWFETQASDEEAWASLLIAVRYNPLRDDWTVAHEGDNSRVVHRQDVFLRSLPRLRLPHLREEEPRGSQSQSGRSVGGSQEDDAMDTASQKEVSQNFRLMLDRSLNTQRRTGQAALDNMQPAQFVPDAVGRPGAFTTLMHHYGHHADMERMQGATERGVIDFTGNRVNLPNYITQWFFYGLFGDQGASIHHFKPQPKRRNMHWSQNTTPTNQEKQNKPSQYSLLITEEKDVHYAINKFLEAWVRMFGEGWGRTTQVLKSAALETYFSIYDTASSTSHAVASMLSWFDKVVESFVTEMYQGTNYQIRPQEEVHYFSLSTACTRMSVWTAENCHLFAQVMQAELRYMAENSIGGSSIKNKRSEGGSSSKKPKITEKDWKARRAEDKISTPEDPVSGDRICGFVNTVNGCPFQSKCIFAHVPLSESDATK
jgi:hypothetical protein